MVYLFEDNRLQILEKYKKEILIRFIITTAIYALGVLLTFIFTTREAMYLSPIILGAYSMIYIGYLFYFILMYVKNYKGNMSFIKKIKNSPNDLKLHHCKALSTDSIVYSMYGVFCHNITFLDIDTKKEFALFVPMENLGEFEVNGIYTVHSYLSVIVSYEVSQ